jgi:hypothetical protein
MLAAMEAELPEPSLTVVTTTDHNALPRYGRDVVVVQRGGPDARPPRYADRVLAVFKTHSALPVNAARPGREPPALTMASSLAYLQVAAAGAPARFGLWTGSLRHRRPIVEPIPMGIMWPCEVECAPIAQRPVDVLFNGSVQTRERRGFRGRIETPKTHSRKTMLARLAELRAEAPDLRIEVTLTPSFANSKATPTGEYWGRLADAKVCLAPRGDTLETYRLFEAARAGCVVVAEKLPSNWFYDHAPVLDMTGWRNLARSLRAVLDDEADLGARQRATVEWWQKYASPDAVGRHVAGVLRDALQVRR